MQLKTIQWLSEEYFEGINLRNEQLNIPSNLTLITDAPVDEELAIHLVAVIDQKVVATLFLDNTSHPHQAQIKQVAVSPDYRGKNIGKSLMNYAEAIALQQGYQSIILNARDSAWKFYEKLGYVAVDQPFEKGSMMMQPYYKSI
ncbi:GNAT family N-acetyltransferase [Vagococcus xieshaowenii]|uniref:GNAT family N-acetyltransferase n=1 Tax=Vagococcus xieshaowenii TaxID=2562451 RepID=A0AAJ5JMA4_9ENTE|nr:GNAT family N-acetyltransferase [Vagococcus xieshaowenii]QCA28393.1 GNAT family N-acetyltransferase [Vagococcus xieshaowenii]TFZ42851.1 GNAT family N-acetyltransferase [Vagococcus xieshaowenii]